MGRALRNRFLIVVLLSGCSSRVAANETPKEFSVSRRPAVLEDRVAIKELVDTFSNLADEKQTQAQSLLFTDNALVETIIDGKVVAALRGRQQIGSAFGAFLKNYETVHHSNGHLTLTLDGDNAAGVSYCAVTLIGVESGKKMRTSIGVYYNDKCIRENGKWFIAERRSTFAWRDKQPMNQ